MQSCKISNYDEAARFLFVLANSKRLTMLRLLLSTEIQVGELANMTDLSPSATSQHLALMRTSGLVKTRREAQTVYYSCDSVAIERFLEMLLKLPLSVEPDPDC